MNLAKKIGLGLSLSVSFLLFACVAGNEQENSATTDGKNIFDKTISAQTSVQTRIKSKPPDPSSSRTAKFTFSCNQLFCTYKCKLDEGSWKNWARKVKITLTQSSRSRMKGSQHCPQKTWEYRRIGWRLPWPQLWATWGLARLL
jgi:hypothetical protein